MKKEIWELVGIIIGDGNIWNDEHHWRVEVTGNLNDDRDFMFNHVKPLFEKFTKNKVVIRERWFGLRLRVCSKDLFKLFLDLGLHPRKEKLNHLEFLNSLDLEKRKLVIRGLTDTDGSVHLSRGKYVRIQISTCSEFLSSWLIETLSLLGFRPTLSKNFEKKGGGTTFRVNLNGRSQLEKWLKTIGFSNSFKLQKSLRILSMWGGTDTGRYHLMVPYAQPGSYISKATG